MPPGHLSGCERFSFIGKNKNKPHRNVITESTGEKPTWTHTYIVNPLHLSTGLQTTSDGETSPGRQEEG